MQLETDETLLLPHAQVALEKYQHQVMLITGTQLLVHL